MKKFIKIAIILLLLTGCNKNKVEETPIAFETIIQNYNEPYIYSIGHIEFPKFKQINPIAFGTTDDILDKNYVGMLELSESLEKTPNHIVLAAHNKKGLFNILTKLKLKDKVNIHTLNGILTYQVKTIYKLPKESTMNLKNTNLLTLITCVDKNEKRLIVELSLDKR